MKVHLTILGIYDYGQACLNVFHYVLLRIEPIRIKSTRDHKSIHNIECDGFKENTLGAKFKNGGKNSLEIGKNFFRQKELQIQKNTHSFFVCFLLKYSKFKC